MSGVLLFVEGTFNNINNTPRTLFRRFCYHSCDWKLVCCPSRIIPANMMSILLYILCKILDNFPDRQDLQSSSPVEHACRSVTPPSTIAILCQHVQEVWKNVSRDGYYYLYARWHANGQACVNTREEQTAY